jgi:hypothetical protein
LEKQFIRSDPLPFEKYAKTVEELAQLEQGELPFIQFEYFLFLAMHDQPAIQEDSASLALCYNWMKRQQRSRVSEVLKFYSDIVEIEKIRKQLPLSATFSRILEVYIPAMSDLAKSPIGHPTDLCVGIIRGTGDASYLLLLNDDRFGQQFMSNRGEVSGWDQ